MNYSSMKYIHLKYSSITCFISSTLIVLILGWNSNQSLFHFIFDVKIAYIPLSVVLISLSTLIGAGIGYIIDYYINQSMHHLNRALIEIERGNLHYQFPEDSYTEFISLQKKINHLASKFETQAITFQQKTSERVENEEKILEEAITKERNRLSRELHDSVSQQLFAISMMTSAMNETVESGTVLEKQLQLVEQMSIQAQSEMRALLLHLRPIQLEGKKLYIGIEELLNELSNKQHIEIRWHVEELTLLKGVEDHLFRILQEAISNTLRHAKANLIEVRLRKIESFALLKVIDDGIGFDTNESKAGSYGLQTMRERVHEIGGIIKIISLSGKGTQIEIKVPIELEE